jgi:ABC-type nitrate/sulfonate/bicarbonate transport system permease component
VERTLRRGRVVTLGARAPRRRRYTAPALSAALPPLVVLVLGVAAWWLYVRLSGVKPYLVPAPETVFRRWWGDPGFFYGEGMVTVSEALCGLALGGGLALAAAVLLAHSRPLERGVLPVAIGLKVTPIVAVAPLFTIWFGFGMTPKVMIAALITFFPVLINGIIGFRSVNPGALDVLRSLHASPVEVFLKLRLPSALPYLFAALKVSASLALIGAMVAEWSGSGRGLGRVILLAHSNLDMPTLFAGIFTLASLGVLLTGVLSLVERRLLFWHDAFRGQR